jgi:hypothetical protein
MKNDRPVYLRFSRCRLTVGENEEEEEEEEEKKERDNDDDDNGMNGCCSCN